MSEIQPRITSLYMHGIGSPELRPAEAWALGVYERIGIRAVPAVIDWEAKENFSNLCERTTEQAAELLDHISPESILVLQGTSAGGSLAVNVAAGLDNDPRIRVICHSARLREGRYEPTDPRNLLGFSRTVKSTHFFASVSASDRIVDRLTTTERQRMFITRPIYDEVVPVKTMKARGASGVRVPAFGHVTGIAMGMAVAAPVMKIMAANHRRNLARQ